MKKLLSIIFLFFMMSISFYGCSNQQGITCLNKDNKIFEFIADKEYSDIEIIIELKDGTIYNDNNLIIQIYWEMVYKYSDSYFAYKHLFKGDKLRFRLGNENYDKYDDIYKITINDYEQIINNK